MERLLYNRLQLGSKRQPAPAPESGVDNGRRRTRYAVNMARIAAEVKPKRVENGG